MSRSDLWALAIIAVLGLAIIGTVWAVQTGYLEFKPRPYHQTGFTSRGDRVYQYDDI